MSKAQMLRGFVNQRLTAAAQEICGLFEGTIAEYEEELCSLKEENERHRKLLCSTRKSGSNEQSPPTSKRTRRTQSPPTSKKNRRTSGPIRRESSFQGCRRLVSGSQSLL
ncbi:uncharacterized protein LOC130193024 isoform X2 [Pseudoliparis swirei]|uniref:uncharacterized protein LOC130193024 isoform X2 n=1 Tax=Pseudoliparis swirei TaxID=2059687 RepID=UPI0024BD6CE5|nr:uncharacterized protein LOC130193024 isoform X2 [Pseudoliparis swirei]